MDYKLSILTGNKKNQLIAAGNPVELKPVDIRSYESDNISISEEIQSSYKEKNLSGHDIFNVIGNALAIEDIHQGDLVLGKLLNSEEKTQIKSGDVLIFRINHESERYKNFPNIPDFKLRKFRTFISFSNEENDNETIIAQVAPIMSEIQQPHIKEKFIKKLDEAKKVLKGESLLLLSVNYLNEDIDFSFHTLADLYARVDYIAKIEKNGEHNEIKELISVNENKDEHLKKALQYLASHKINQYFCSTKESFRKEALINIFTHAQSQIRGAFNRLSDITNDNELMFKLSEFLRKGGKVDLIVYNNDQWTFEQFILHYNLTNLETLISIKQTPQGAQFARNDNGIKNGITFCLGDEDMYVLRPNINAPFVECNFNNSDFYNIISPIFEQQMQTLPNIGL